MKKAIFLFSISLLVLSSCERGIEDPDPVSCFTANKTNVSIGELIQFTNCSKNALSFGWSFGDGTSSTSENPEHTYTMPGTFSVKLKVYQKNKTDETSLTIVVQDNESSIQISTKNVTEITANGAISGGNITDDGADQINQRGVCWSTNQQPTVNDDKTTDGSGDGSFTSTISGLNPETTYYLRAYASNSNETAYGNQVSFETAQEQIRNCAECHSTEIQNSIQNQYDLSAHALGSELIGYAGTRASCAQCHSNEGFIEYAVNGYVENDFESASIISCATCHAKHTTVDTTDAAIRLMTPVTLVSTFEVVDLQGSDNLCANCHQARRSYVFYEQITEVNIDGTTTPVGDGEVGISSTHAGPHHSPAVNFIFGLGGYGSEVSHTHKTVGCTGCHKGDYNNSSGGHTFIPSINNCTNCHSGATDFDINGVVTEYNSRLTAVADVLITEGALIYDEAEDIYIPVVSIVSEDVFKAFWNFMLIYEDGSMGLHNPQYTEVLLTTAEAFLGIK